MGRLWEKKIDKMSMEGAIIEVFGCASLHNPVITLFKGKEKISSDFYLNGNRQEAALIEIFGCVSFDKVVNFDLEKENVVEVYKRYEPIEALIVGIA
ncbi:MAG: hypothetical protein N2596_02420 [Syntrophorhabdaceae bacterium]|nr:hypothetical protein [Syntrophorhabdaceae bacterium]